MVELKPKVSRTQQKTVRVPTHILEALEEDAAKVRGCGKKGISVPQAIVQILEDWYVRREKACA